jgi:Family of unknown function (DUF5372)
VAHPHHPLCGQHVQIVRIRQGADPDLIVRLAGGYHAAIAMSWTDYAGGTAPPTPRPDLPLLDSDGLRRAADFIARLRQEGDLPATPHGTS